MSEKKPFSPPLPRLCIKILLYAPNKDQMSGGACYSPLPSQRLLEGFMEKTIRKVAQRGNYLFYNRAALIDLIKGSRPFPESRNTFFYGRVTSPPSRQIIDRCKMSCTSTPGVTLKTHTRTRARPLFSLTEENVQACSSLFEL